MQLLKHTRPQKGASSIDFDKLRTVLNQKQNSSRSINVLMCEKVMHKCM